MPRSISNTMWARLSRGVGACTVGIRCTCMVSTRHDVRFFGRDETAAWLVIAMRTVLLVVTSVALLTFAGGAVLAAVFISSDGKWSAEMLLWLTPFVLLALFQTAVCSVARIRVPALWSAVGTEILVSLFAANLYYEAAHPSSSTSALNLVFGPIAILLGAPILFLLGIPLVWTILRRLRPSEELRCRHCGYSLIGLPEPRCPECGLPFPQDFVGSGQRDDVDRSAEPQRRA